MKFPVRRDAHFSRQEIGQMFLQPGQIGAKSFPDICRIIHAAHPFFTAVSISDLSRICQIRRFLQFLSSINPENLHIYPIFITYTEIYKFSDTITFT